MSIYLDTAKKQIAKGLEVDIVSASLVRHFKQLDEQEFNTKLQEEYELLFPSTRDMNEEEFYEYQSTLGLLDEQLVGYTDLEVIPQADIEYSEDETYLTFEEYKNETRIITEAVEATYDEEGLLLTEGVEEVTELIRPYVSKDDFEDEINLFLMPYVKQQIENRIIELEQLALRPTRELLVDSSNNYALDKLSKIEEELAELRAKLYFD